MPWFRSILVVLLLSAVASADHEVTTLNNKTTRGTVVNIAGGEVHVRDNIGTIQKVPLSQVLAIEMRAVKFIPKDTKYSLIRLFDDSELLCKTIDFKGDKVHVELLSGQKAILALESLTSLLRDAHNKELRKQFEEKEAKVTRSDRILLLRNGQLNPIPGALGDVDAAGQNIQFQIAITGTIRKMPLQSLQGMIWHRIKSPFKSPVCLVIDTMGNRIGAKEISVKDDKFIVTLPAGGTIEFAESALAKLDYNRGKLTYLSDLKPSELIEQSNVGLIIRHQVDQNLDGQPIFFGEVKHHKGLSMHAHTEMEYDLGRKFKEFKAVIGADPRVGGTESKAIVIVRGDGAELYRKQVSTTPEDVALNIRNVQRLRIIVQSSNVLDLHDHATLADARVVQ